MIKQTNEVIVHKGQLISKCPFGVIVPKVHHEINCPLARVRSPEISAFTNTRQFNLAEVKSKNCLKLWILKR